MVTGAVNMSYYPGRRISRCLHPRVVVSYITLVCRLYHFIGDGNLSVILMLPDAEGHVDSVGVGKGLHFGGQRDIREMSGGFVYEFQGDGIGWNAWRATGVIPSVV